MTFALRTCGGGSWLRRVDGHGGQREVGEPPALGLGQGRHAQAPVQLVPLQRLEARADPALQPARGHAARRRHRRRHRRRAEDEDAEGSGEEQQEPHVHTGVLLVLIFCFNFSCSFCFYSSSLDSLCSFDWSLFCSLLFRFLLVRLLRRFPLDYSFSSVHPIYNSFSRYLSVRP